MRERMPKKEKARLLIVDDDPHYVRSMERVLSRDYSVSSAGSPQEALAALQELPDLALLDIRFSKEDASDRQGIELLKAIKAHSPNLPVVMMTAHGDVEVAVDAMRQGAADFIQKARMSDTRELSKFLRSVLDRHALSRRVAQLEHDLNRLEPWEIVGETPQIHEVKQQIEMAADDGYVTVLLRGDTGTGKELAARAIWLRGRRATAPFVTVAIPTLNPSVVESELFGHETGAFTDAKQRRVGYIEQANGGVLFLDEIGDLAADLQVKLLRFLDERAITRMGSNTPRALDVQVVAATNRDLEAAVKQGEFRQDLLYRLNALQISLPTLHDRRDDIPLLATHFLNRLRQQGRTRIEEVSPAAIERLQSHSWPGNVRELYNAIQSAILPANRSGHEQIEESDLPAQVLSAAPHREDPRPEVGEEGVQLDEALARFELAYVEAALRSSRGKKTEAWKLLGLNDRFALRRRVKRILELYPQASGSFPLVWKSYGGGEEAEGEDAPGAG